jgi:hypothetical protein
MKRCTEPPRRGPAKQPSVVAFRVGRNAGSRRRAIRLLTEAYPPLWAPSTRRLGIRHVHRNGVGHIARCLYHAAKSADLHGKPAGRASSGIADDDAQPIHPAEPGREDQAHPRGSAVDQSQLSIRKRSNRRRPTRDADALKATAESLAKAVGSNQARVPRPHGGSPEC